MDFGWSDRGQWFPFPCQLRSKHRDTGSYFSSMSGPMSSAVKLKIPISEKRKRACPPFFPPPLHLCPTPHHPVPCPLTFITHFLFMLGRNRGCSWWFEVRRDWPRVTLNKYTRTSQEGAGRLYLLPNHPWLISWQIQGDFLCTLSTIAIPSPPPIDSPLSPTHKPTEGDGIRAAQTGQSRQPSRWSVATQSCLCNTHDYKTKARVCAPKDVHKGTNRIAHKTFWPATSACGL